MKRCFTICYSEEEANEVGHFILSRGYEGVQNDSYRYCRDAIRFALQMRIDTIEAAFMLGVMVVI